MVETMCVGLHGGGVVFTDTPLNDLMKDKADTCHCGRTFDSNEELMQHIKEIEIGDRCGRCHHLLTDDEFEGAYETRGECHGTPCNEYIIHGYKCKECGNDGVF
jgi:hypothetical protein